MELLFKIGNQYLPDHPLFEMGWRDGQLVDIRPDGFHHGKLLRKHFLVLQVPLDYWALRGTTDWKAVSVKIQALKAYMTKRDNLDRLPWDSGFVDTSSKTDKRRDFFLDYKRALDSGLITLSQFDRLYDKTREKPNFVVDKDFTTLLLREGVVQRLPSIYSANTGSISIGTGTVGSDVGDDYASWTAAVADLIDLTGNLTLQGARAEEMSESSGMTISIDTSTYTLDLNVASGAEHNGGAYGNGHRITFGTYDQFLLSEAAAGTLNKVTFADLAIDASGSSNFGINLGNAADNDPTIIERCLLKGDSNTRNLIACAYNNKRIIIRDNICYGASQTGTANYGFGVYLDDEYGFTQWEVYNNTACKNDKGIGFESSTPSTGTAIAKNNLCQGNVTDYAQTASWDTTAKNLSQDATSPDASYQSLNKQSWFTDYTNDDYREGGSDTDLDDGDNLSAIGSPAQFSDDIERVTRSLWYIGASEYVAAGGYTLTADAGSYTVTGTAAGLAATRTITAASGSYAYTGSTAGLAVGYKIAANTGTYSYTGVTAGLAHGRKLTAASGSYSYIGQDATLTYGTAGGYTLVAASGSYALTGTAVALKADRTLAIGAGSYSVSGQAAVLKADRSIASASGSYSYSGQTVGLSIGYKISIASGAYAYTGQDATLTSSGVAITIPGLEYTLLDNRLHYTLEENLEHFTLPTNRLHYTARNED